MPMFLIIFKSKNDLILFSYIAVFAGLLFFLLAFLGIGKTGIDYGWSAYGGPITFYKIEFASFCCAMYLSINNENLKFKISLYCIAALNLFSVFMTQSKTPVAAIIIILFYLVIILFIIKKYTLGIITCITIVATLEIFIFVNGKLLINRINYTARIESITSIQKRMTAAEYNQLLSKFFGEKKIKKMPRLNAKEIREINYILDFFSVNCYQNKDENKQLQCIKEYLHYYESTFFYIDTSDRIKLTMHGIKLAKKNPLFGVGIAKYKLPIYNIYTKEIFFYEYPHNIILEIALATGIIGFSLISLLLITLIVILHQELLHNYEIIFFISLLFFFLLSSCLAGNYYDFRFVVYVPLIVLGSLRNNTIS